MTRVPYPGPAGGVTTVLANMYEMPDETVVNAAVPLQTNRVIPF